MALVTPLLILIMFGAFEAGNYFWNQHIVTNAVRDGVRFASRKPLSEFDADCQPSPDVKTQTENVTRTGQTIDGSARIATWTADVVIDVDGDCSTTTTGIYVNNETAAPIVTVSVTVPYDPLFNGLGVLTDELNMVAKAQAPVMGF